MPFLHVKTTEGNSSPLPPVNTDTMHVMVVGVQSVSCQPYCGGVGFSAMPADWSSWHMNHRSRQRLPVGVSQCEASVDGRMFYLSGCPVKR